jgi:hypothetical protein
MAASCGLSLAWDPIGNSCKIHHQNCSTNETKLCRNAHYGRPHRNLEENSHVCEPIGTKITTLGKDLIRIVATKFGLILFSGSQEEIQNVKSLQTTDVK